MPNPLAESFRFNRWANLVLLDACQALSDEQMDAPSPVAHGTIRRCLQHLAGGEQTFVLRTSGRQNEGELSPLSPWPGWDELRAILTTAGGQLIAVAEAMTEDVDVVLPYFGREPVFPKSFFLAHALGHSAEHRTQVSVAMSLLGVDAPDLDGWAYALAMGYGKV